MSDKPVIQIDDDWKRQAQEEKRKLAEREAAAKKPAAPPPASSSAASAAPPSASVPAARTLPEASFTTLVQSVMTQALYYLGELAEEGEQPLFSLDAAKNQIDLLGVLDAKTRGNLESDEQSLLDQALYDLRSRFVSIASQYIR